MESTATNNWRPPPQGVAEDPNEWRSQLPPEARQRIVSKIMDTLKKHLPISAPEGLGELNKIAVRFEEKIYNAATSQADYLRKISMKMLTMEQKNPGSNVPSSGPTNGSIANQSSPDAGRNSINIVMPASQQKQTLAQNLSSNHVPNNLEVSTNMGTGLPAMTGLNQSTIPNIAQNNMQAMSGVSQNTMNNSSGQGSAQNIYGNTQRQQVQGRQLQQSIVSQQQQQQQQQQQSQNQLAYQQQLMKQKLTHPSLLQSQLSQQPKPQSMLQATLQSPQQTIMQMTSGLQSNQTSLQNQQSVLQPVSQNVQQNQQNTVQQGVSSIYQQSQSRPQQTSQQSALQQQASTILQQSSSLGQQSLSTQQQLPGHQSNVTGIQGRHFGQQNGISDVQQQQLQQQHLRLPTQQNGLLTMQQSQQSLSQQNVSMHQQQQLATQNNIQVSQPQQQSQQQHPQHQIQMLGSQSTMTNIQQHPQPTQLLQHSKSAGQVPQTSNALLQLQGQPPSQQQHMGQLQSQSMQLQPLPLQSQQTSLQREMHQRYQAPGTLLQSQNVMEQQRQTLQNQRVLTEAPSTSMDSTAQTTQAGGDVQEEIYQKIKILKDKYYPDLHEMHQKLSLKLQQHEGLVLPAKQSEQLENMKKFKMSIERIIHVLQMPKSNIQPGFKEKLPAYEKQIIGLVNSNRKRQPQGAQFGGINQSMQSQPSQVAQLQRTDALLNPVQQLNMSTSVQPTVVSSMQGGTMPSATQFGAHSTPQNLMNTLQACSNMDSSQVNAVNSLQQAAVGSLPPGSLGTLHQASVNAQQQNSLNALMHNNVNTLQNGVNPLQQNSTVLQHQQIKQEQQLSQQIKQQFHQRQFQQQQIIQQQQKQQILQQQQQQQQQQSSQLQQQHASQVQPHQMQQFHQINEMNELKQRQQGMKFQSHNQTGQRQAYYQQQLKLPSTFSPQSLQTTSPLMSQHPSPQVDQQTLLPLNKSGTPLQTTPPLVAPSPSTPLAPSPLPGDHEKQVSGVSSLSNAGNAGQLVPGQAQVPPLAVGTPGISPSPLLAELDSFQPIMSTVVPGKPSSLDQPLERLIKAVKSSSRSVLRSSVSDIGSVVSMIDRIAGAAPGNGSRAAVGEDLVAMTKCRLQARNFMSQDGSATTRKMKRQISAMPLNAVSSTGSANESFQQLPAIDTSELESTATSNFKRPKIEVSHALLNEIRDINLQLIDTIVDLADDDIDAAAEGGEGTVVKCTFCAVALSPNLKSQIASTDVSPISPLRLFIPSKYPLCSPILLDKIPAELRESEDLSAKARSRFSISLRGLPQRMSLTDMAKTWDISAREVILEYAQQNGGGSFSSRYGAWENCVGA